MFYGQKNPVAATKVSLRDMRMVSKRDLGKLQIICSQPIIPQARGVKNANGRSSDSFRFLCVFSAKPMTWCI